VLLLAVDPKPLCTNHASKREQADLKPGRELALGRVGFQNDRVRVLQIKYGPHEQSVMHGHPASVAVFLTEGETRFSFADGKTSTSKVEAGQVRWLEKEMHLPENDVSKAFEVVVVELR
jgi:quercetin dioxygenase-like cupin family protein